MIISLVGYMGSGKSHISKILSDKLGLELFDLDREISTLNGMPIAELFAKKGEIFFRRQEKDVLGQIFQTQDNCVVSLGGGTPAYYDNMATINRDSTSIYLRTSVGALASRLAKQKEKRPLISRIPDEDLPEFIAKHLFERSQFYNQSKLIVDTDGKTPEEIADEIILRLS